MRASFLDPQGPLRARVAPYAALLLAFLAVSQVPWLTSAHTAALTFFSIAVACAFRLVLRRGHRPRVVELRPGPGYVDIRKAGAQGQRISARSVQGATTAATARGVLLTLNLQRRSSPITIEVDTEAEADTIRRALGIGHGGFGTIAWRTRAESSHKISTFGAIGVLLWSLLMFAVALSTNTEAVELTLALSILPLQLLGPLMLAGIFATAGSPTVCMGATGLDLRTPRGWFHLPYWQLRGVQRTGRFLSFDVGPPHDFVLVECAGKIHGADLTQAEEDNLRAQLLSAAARARGLGPSKEDATGRVDVLRRNDEAPRQWLTRLDMAGQMLASPSGYRSLSFEVEDLWRTLEDPEADPELRVAAVRVLRHSPEPNTKVRIDEAVAAVRDQGASRKLRIATNDDLDAASHELALVDLEEQRMRAHLPRSL